MIGIIGAYLDIFRLARRLNQQRPSQAKAVVFGGFTPLIMEMIASLGVSLAVLVIWIMIMTQGAFHTP
jgi:hypothetical protein